MEQAFQNGQPEQRAKPFKMFKKRSMTSIASYQVSPHTARIFKENERLIDKYKQKSLITLRTGDTALVLIPFSLSFI